MFSQAQTYPHYANTYKKQQKLADQYRVGIDAPALRLCMESIPAFKVLRGAAVQQHLSIEQGTNCARVKQR